MTGERCDRHVGEVFPPRCSACDALQRERPPERHRRLGFIPGSSCPLHPNWPLPCLKCERIADDQP